jgi:TPR repeat protein
MPKPDAETATFWYEPAASAGNVEAQRRMGEILTSLYPSGFQYNMGLTWLEKAAKAGDAKAQAALDKLQ